MSMLDSIVWQTKIKDSNVWENFISAYLRIKYGDKHEKFRSHHDNGVDDYIKEGIVCQSKFTHWDTKPKNQFQHLAGQLVQFNKNTKVTTSSIESAWLWAKGYANLTELEEWSLFTNLDLGNSSVSSLKSFIQKEFERINVKVKRITIHHLSDLSTDLENPIYRSIRVKYLDDLPPTLIPNADYLDFLNEKQGLGINYQLPLVGRDDELETLSKYLSENNTVIVDATQGMGKTKFIKEWCSQHDSEYDIYWIWDNAGNSLQSEFATLAENPGRNRIFIIDRAEANIASVTSLLSTTSHPNQSGKNKIICICRTTSVHQLKEIFYQYSQKYPKELKLDLIDKTSMDALLKHLDYSPIDRRNAINILVNYPPLYAYIVAKELKTKIFADIIRDDDIKSLLLSSLAYLSGKTKQFCYYLAFLQPLKWTSEIKNYLCTELSINEIELGEILQNLQDEGVIYRKGLFFRFQPDLLGQELLTELNLNNKGTDTFYKLRDKLLPQFTEQVLVNLAMAENTDRKDDLLGDWFAQLKLDLKEMSNSKRQQLLNSIKNSIGHVKPEYAQTLIEIIMLNPKEKDIAWGGIPITHDSLIQDLRQIVIDSMQTPGLIKSGMELLANLEDLQNIKFIAEVCGQKGGRDFWNNPETERQYYTDSFHKPIIEVISSWLESDIEKNKLIALEIIDRLLHIDVTYTYVDPLNPHQFHIESTKLNIKAHKRLIETRNKAWALLFLACEDTSNTVRKRTIEVIRNSVDSFYRAISNRRLTRPESHILQKIETILNLKLNSEIDYDEKLSVEETSLVYNKYRREPHRINLDALNRSHEYVTYRELFGELRFYRDDAMQMPALCKYVEKNVKATDLIKIIEYKHTLDNYREPYGRTYSLLYHLSEAYPIYGYKLESLIRKSSLLERAGYLGTVYAGLVSSSIANSKRIKRQLSEAYETEPNAILRCFRSLDLAKINKDDLTLLEKFLNPKFNKYHKLLGILFVKLLELDTDRIWKNLHSLIRLKDSGVITAICQELFFSKRSFSGFSDEQLWPLIDNISDLDEQKGRETYPFEKLLNYLCAKSSVRVLRCLDNLKSDIPYGLNKELTTIKESPDFAQGIDMLFKWSTGKNFRKIFLAKEILASIISDEQTLFEIEKNLTTSSVVRIRSIASFISEAPINEKTLDFFERLINKSNGDPETISNLLYAFYRGLSGTIGQPPKELIDDKNMITNRLKLPLNPAIKSFYLSALDITNKLIEEWGKSDNFLKEDL